MLLLFELKKEITHNNLKQVQARLLLANLRSPKTQPAMVLTDLRDKWHLLWMDQSTINHHCFISRAEAVGFIEDFLAGGIEASEGVDPSAARVAKRRKLGGQLAA
ncbi:g8513 [Coccomyxa elongata]